MMKKLLGIAMLLMSFAANAAHSCAGNVSTVDLRSNGTVYASIESIGSANAVCSVTANLGEFNPEACKILYSMLTTAQVAGKKIRLWFRNDADKNCAKGNWKNFGSDTYQLYFSRLEN